MRATAPNDEERELFVLGVLSRQALSAYAIACTVRDHVPLYRSFKRGNLYHFVEKLATAGLLKTETAAAKRGPRETKAIYHLTDAGEARFRKILRQVLLDEQAADAAFETALVLLGQLPRSEAIRLLTRRATGLSEHERRTLRVLGELRRCGAGAYIGESHTIHRLRSQQRFLSDMIALLRDPKWQPDWVLTDVALLRKA